jgi:hypothetical protein
MPSCARIEEELGRSAEYPEMDFRKAFVAYFSK